MQLVGIAIPQYSRAPCSEGTCADRTADHAAASADRVLRWLVNVRLAAMPSHLSAEIDIPEFRMRGLFGRVTDHWSIWVNGSWIVTFRFIGGDEELLDYLDNL